MIKCSCKQETCEMYLNVNQYSNNTIWLEIEDIQCDVDALAKMPRNKNGFVRSRTPFALSPKQAIELAHKLIEFALFPEEDD